MHPLLAILEDAAEGRFPSPDGTVEVLAPDGTGYLSVTALTGRAFVLADVHPAELSARGADGFGGALAPDVPRWLAGPDGVIGSVDVVLTTRARASSGVRAPTIGHADAAAHASA
ncbi:MAG: hypothetical protein H0U21_05100 [Acidimicrobiia bacterium]|nr:hypothetical protein [Acidimicrobiia bacterium]